MGKGIEEITIENKTLGAKGVLIIVREVDQDYLASLPAQTFRELDQASSFRVERVWKRGDAREVLLRCKERERAEGFMAGVAEGIKLGA